MSIRDFLKSSGRRLRTAWIWPLALLALPNCFIDGGPFDPPPVFTPGDAPRTNAVMCDIPKPSESPVVCATAADLALDPPPVSLSAAATALAEGHNHYNFALDWSDEAVNQCGGPAKVEFFGPFPAGYTVCLNCKTQITGMYDDTSAVCFAQCKDLVMISPYSMSNDEANAFCANVKVSTNFDKDLCYDDACTEGGMPRGDFPDPRRIPEPIQWLDLIGTTAAGGTLSQNVPDTGTPADFNAGAASAQVITEGDAWVEFEARENTLSHVIGVRHTDCIPAVSNCEDNEPSLAQAGLIALSLNLDGMVYVIESNGTPDPIVHGLSGEFGAYEQEKRFRVKVTDNHDQTASISFSRLTEVCTIGAKCAEEVFFQFPGPSLPYPLRVDASFREENGQLTNVTIVRIIKIIQ